MSKHRDEEEQQSTPEPDSLGNTLGRMRIDKTFSGDLDATSEGTMLAAHGTVEGSAGYVALEEVKPRSMESRRQPGLFLCGELLDAFGPIGGHNFQWAWSTGRAAGMGAAAYVAAAGTSA